MQLDFADSVLYVSLRSPFARRVRLAFLENGVPYREEVRDVWIYHEDYARVNPLHRVPALQLKSGPLLTESSLMLELFYREPRPLSYRSESELFEGHAWSGFAVGLIEKTIDFFLEKIRPEAQRDREVLDDFPRVCARVLDRFEPEVRTKTTLVGGRLTQADLDWASALGYLRFRGDPEILQSYPETRKFLENWDEKPHFRATAPRG